MRNSALEGSPNLLLKAPTGAQILDVFVWSYVIFGTAVGRVDLCDTSPGKT